MNDHKCLSLYYPKTKVTASVYFVFTYLDFISNLPTPQMQEHPFLFINFSYTDKTLSDELLEKPFFVFLLFQRLIETNNPYIIQVFPLHRFYLIVHSSLFLSWFLLLYHCNLLNINIIIQFIQHHFLFFFIFLCVHFTYWNAFYLRRPYCPLYYTLAKCHISMFYFDFSAPTIMYRHFMMYNTITLVQCSG